MKKIFMMLKLVKNQENFLTGTMGKGIILNIKKMFSHIEYYYYFNR